MEEKTKIKVLFRREQEKWVLGNRSIVPTTYLLLFIALCPLFLEALFYYLLLLFLGAMDNK